MPDPDRQEGAARAKDGERPPVKRGTVEPGGSPEPALEAPSGDSHAGD